MDRSGERGRHVRLSHRAITLAPRTAAIETRAVRAVAQTLFINEILLGRVGENCRVRLNICVRDNSRHLGYVVFFSILDGIKLPLIL